MNVLNVQVHYYNGDLKEVSERGVTKYLYQDSQTWHTTHPDGREVTVFSNGQTEVSLFPPNHLQTTGCPPKKFGTKIWKA